MLQAQIELGQRLRQAYEGAMERKERLLQHLTERQVELGSQEMVLLLANADQRWFTEQGQNMGGFQHD